MMPAMARQRRLVLDSRIEALVAFAEDTPLNRVESRDSSIGVVCSGVTYQYVREAMPEASVCKLGVTFPLPPKLLREFADSVDTLYVVEEADTYLRRSLLAMGIEVGDLDAARLGRTVARRVSAGRSECPVPSCAMRRSRCPRGPRSCARDALIGPSSMR